MYKFFAAFFSVLISLPVFASGNVITKPYYTRAYSPYYNNYYAQNRFRQPYYSNRKYYNSELSDFNQLERYAFDRNYFKENELIRLERLEKQAFGAVQQGDFRTRYENVRSEILSRPKANNYQKQSVLKTIGNYFSGQLTGYTPGLDDDFFIPNNYGNRKYTTYSSPWGNGYRYSDYETGSSTGVRILD